MFKYHPWLVLGVYVGLCGPLVEPLSRTGWFPRALEVEASRSEVEEMTSNVNALSVNTRGSATLQRSRLVGWFAERPRVADLFVILTCLTPTVATLIIAPPAHAWIGYLCAGGVAVTFWWRRAHPFGVLIIVVTLATLNPITADGVSPAFLESSFALFALAKVSSLRRTINGYLISEGMIFATGSLLVLLGARETWPMVLLQPASLVAIALGVATQASRARREATEALIAAREDSAAAAERARITAEMHDVVGHSVTVMIALAGGAASGWEKHPERARAALEQLNKVGARTLQQMQRILHVLREQDSDLDRSLESSGHNLPSLQELMDTFKVAGLPLVLAIESEETANRLGQADPVLMTSVHRIVQESLTNVLRHASDVTHVETSVVIEDGQVVVAVTDNGRGVSRGPTEGAGIGLRAMRERAYAFGGDFSAGPLPRSKAAPGGGWRTCVSIPMRDGSQW